MQKIYLVDRKELCFITIFDGSNIIDNIKVPILLYLWLKEHTIETQAQFIHFYQEARDKQAFMRRCEENALNDITPVWAMPPFFRVMIVSDEFGSLAEFRCASKEAGQELFRNFVYYDVVSFADDDLTDSGFLTLAQAYEICEQEHITVTIVEMKDA